MRFAWLPIQGKILPAARLLAGAMPKTTMAKEHIPPPTTTHPAQLSQKNGGLTMQQTYGIGYKEEN